MFDVLLMPYLLQGKILHILSNQVLSHLHILEHQEDHRRIQDYPHIQDLPHTQSNQAVQGETDHILFNRAVQGVILNSLDSDLFNQITQEVINSLESTDPIQYNQGSINLALTGLLARTYGNLSLAGLHLPT